jgi:hypothetical protein
MPDKDWRATFEFVEGATGRINDLTFCTREHQPDPIGANFDGNTVASDLATWLSTLARAMCPTTMSLGRVYVNRGGPYGPGEGDPQEAGETSVNAAGTLSVVGGHSLPHGLCARVTVRTTLAGKRGTGRFHAPWPGSDLCMGGDDIFNTGSAYWSAVVAFANALLAGHDRTAGVDVHHYSLRVHSRADNATRDAKAVVPRQRVSYLRSRLTAP